MRTPSPQDCAQPHSNLSELPLAAGVTHDSLIPTLCHWVTRCLSHPRPLLQGCTLPLSPPPSVARVSRCPIASAHPHPPLPGSHAAPLTLPHLPRSCRLAPSPPIPLIPPELCHLTSPLEWSFTRVGLQSHTLPLAHTAWVEGGGNVVHQLGQDRVNEVGHPSVHPTGV